MSNPPGMAYAVDQGHPSLGSVGNAPLRPHLLQRDDRRSMSLDVSGPPSNDQRHEPRRAPAKLLKSRRGHRVLHADEHGAIASAEQPPWVASMSAVTALYVGRPSVSIFRVLSAPTTLSYQGSARLNRAPNIRLADRRARFGVAWALRRDVCIRGRPAGVGAWRATRRSRRRQKQSQY